MTTAESVVALRGLLAQVDDVKRRATGVSCDVDALDLRNADADTEPGFDALVSAIYTFWREVFTHDVVYLLNVADNVGLDARDAKRFTTAVRNLRTAAQHADAGDAVRFAEGWRLRACGAGSPVSTFEWSSCARALLGQFAGAILVLREVATWILARPEHVSFWAAHVNEQEDVDPVAVRERVSNDLGLILPRGSQGHVDRAINYQFGRRRLTVQDSAGEVLESIVERELVAFTLKRLPCRYVDVLDQLNSWGDQAVASLCLAHAVAELEVWDSVAEFLDAVASLWSAIVPDGS